MSKTSTNLRDALLAELIDQVSNGPAASDGEGTLTRVSPPANVLAAALNYLKQYPPEAGDVGASTLSSTLKRHASVTSGPTAIN